MPNEQLLNQQARRLAQRLRVSLAHARLLAELAFAAGRPA
jgi:hypothetical protein